MLKKGGVCVIDFHVDPPAERPRPSTRSATARPGIDELSPHLGRGEREPQTAATNPWPTELRLHKDRKTLTVAFDNGESFRSRRRISARAQPERGGAGPFAGRAQDRRRQAATSRSWRSTRSAITRCGSCSTTCTRPGSSAGTICSSSAETARPILAGLSRRARRQGAGAVSVLRYCCTITVAPTWTRL